MLSKGDSKSKVVSELAVATSEALRTAPSPAIAVSFDALKRDVIHLFATNEMLAVDPSPYAQASS
ncbi:hypothetical protein D3C85_1679620 [compost metagenome]